MKSVSSVLRCHDRPFELICFVCLWFCSLETLNAASPNLCCWLISPFYKHAFRQGLCSAAFRLCSVILQGAVSHRILSSPSSPAASCTLWKRWRGTGRWCSAAKPREAQCPCTGECHPHQSLRIAPLLSLCLLFIQPAMSTSFNFKQPVTGKCLRLVFDSVTLWQHCMAIRENSSLPINPDMYFLPSQTISNVLYQASAATHSSAPITQWHVSDIVNFHHSVEVEHRDAVHILLKSAQLRGYIFQMCYIVKGNILYFPYCFLVELQCCPKSTEHTSVNHTVAPG